MAIFQSQLHSLLEASPDAGLWRNSLVLRLPWLWSNVCHCWLFLKHTQTLFIFRGSKRNLKIVSNGYYFVPLRSKSKASIIAGISNSKRFSWSLTSYRFKKNIGLLSLTSPTLIMSWAVFLKSDELNFNFLLKKKKNRSSLLNLKYKLWRLRMKEAILKAETPSSNELDSLIAEEQ